MTALRHGLVGGEGRAFAGYTMLHMQPRPNAKCCQNTQEYAIRCKCNSTRKFNAIFNSQKKPYQISYQTAAGFPSSIRPVCPQTNTNYSSLPKEIPKYSQPSYFKKYVYRSPHEAPAPPTFFRLALPQAARSHPQRLCISNPKITFTSNQNFQFFRKSSNQNFLSRFTLCTVFQKIAPLKIVFLPKALAQNAKLAQKIRCARNSAATSASKEFHVPQKSYPHFWNYSRILLPKFCKR